MPRENASAFSIPQSKACEPFPAGPRSWRDERAPPSGESSGESLTFSFECAALRYTCTASWFADGGLGELFLGNHRGADSHADACAEDAAILASLALQFGVPLDVIRRALLRDGQGRASTPIGVALDLLAVQS